MSRSDRRRGQARSVDSQRAVSEAAVAGAGGVVFDPDGQVLLLRHANGSWVFPKGHIDAGERPLEAAVREIHEEAGVRACCDDPDARWTTRYHNARGELRQITWFRMRTQSRTPVLREKTFPDGAFLPTTEAARRLTFQEDRNLLARVLAGSSPNGAPDPATDAGLPVADGDGDV